MSILLIICLISLVASLLTFFSGFGLGTILTPAFALFFPIDLSIALTGVVHFLNNIFKLGLIGMKADKNVVLRFGLPAFVASFAGAYLLIQLTEIPPLYIYYIGHHECTVTVVKIIVATLLIFFALMEVLPVFKNLTFTRERLFTGGVLSGFFGGLSGHQGALRSAFLIKSNLSKEAFIATGIVIACLVDVSRLGVYSTRFMKAGVRENLILVIAATISAFAGAYAGNRLLKKITYHFIQIIVTIMLFIIAVLLGMGIV